MEDDDDDIIKAGLVQPAPQDVQHLGDHDEIGPNDEFEPAMHETADDDEVEKEGEDGDDEQDEDKDKEDDDFVLVLILTSVSSSLLKTMMGMQVLTLMLHSMLR